MTDQPETRDPGADADGDALPDRREAMLALAGGVAAAAATAAASALSAPPGEAERPPEGALQYAMVIDVRRCIGCHSCTVACKSEFDVPLGQSRSWVEYVEKGEYPYVGRSFLPRLCNHCSNPPCVTVCPTGATYKRAQDGVVVVDTGICIGCKYCIQACPYEARFLNPVTGIADKCDFCMHRVQKGLVPSCVNTFLASARIFGEVTDPESEVSRLIASEQVTVLRSEMGTLPNVYYIGADHTDTIDAKRPGVRAVEVDNHRRRKEWR